MSEAPGRVNLIGEHTDYNEGFVLPVAIDRTVAVAAAMGEGKRVRVYSADFDARDEWPVDSPRRTGRREWRDYVRGVAWALQEDGYGLRGADLTVAGDVALGAGLSSSAALEVAVRGALCAVAGIEVEPQRLALLCQKAENRFVGVQCGVMDQLAAVCSRAGHALLLDCRSLEMEHVLLPENVAIVVVDSKVPRRLGDTAYNQRRKECAAAAQALGVKSLRDATEEHIERLADPLRRRERHVTSENQRVREAADALRVNDVTRVGALMFESHASLRDDFEVSTPELDMLIELASRSEGVNGARLTGAGFGGCTVNLVDRDAVGRFEQSVVAPYREKTGLAAEMLVCRAVDGLRVTSV
jgi:galactokinase